MLPREPRPRSGLLLFVLLGLAVCLLLVLRPCVLELIRRQPPPRLAVRDTATGAPLDSALVAQLAPRLRRWVGRWQETLPGFNLSQLRSAWEYDPEPVQPEPDAPPGPDTTELCRREALGYISYSPDRSAYVDRNAYAAIVITGADTTVESEPDQLVQLVDRRRNTRTRLAFHGTASSTDEVLWLDDSTIVLCGSGENHTGGRLRYLPHLYLVRLGRLAVVAYTVP